MTNIPTKTYLVGVIERAIAYYKVEAEDGRSAAQNWDDGEFHDRDDEALESEGPCNVRERQPDGTWMKLPPSEWEAKPSAGQELLEALVYLVEQADEDCPLENRSRHFIDALENARSAITARRYGSQS
jgi:hypothetical protein